MHGLPDGRLRNERAATCGSGKVRPIRRPLSMHAGMIAFDRALGGTTSSMMPIVMTEVSSTWNGTPMLPKQRPKQFLIVVC